MLRHPFLVAATIVALPCVAAPPAPDAGSFGFDWLKPNTAKCVALPEAAMKDFRSCVYNADGTFGLRDPAFACRKNEKSEYLFYESKAACVRNFETMEANAP
jgi:hypothetical protein